MRLTKSPRTLPTRLSERSKEALRLTSAEEDVEAEAMDAECVLEDVGAAKGLLNVESASVHATKAIAIRGERNGGQADAGEEEEDGCDMEWKEPRS